MALRGDLADASPGELLSSLGEQQASGCLAIDRATRALGGDVTEESTATLHLRNGAVYAAALSGGTFLVGTRLVTSHTLDAEALSEALEAQRSDLTGWRLGEILVHLGHINADVVEQISLEQVLEISTEVLAWRGGSWKFRSGERTRAMLPHPLAIPELVRATQARATEWRELLPTVGGRHVPLQRTAAAVPGSASRELAALLRAADEHFGEGGLETCSHAAGLSLLEGARLVASARSAGLLVALPAEQRIAVGDDWPSPGRAAPSRQNPRTTSTPGPSALVLARKPAVTEPASIFTSYALARLLELEGPPREHAAEPAPPAVDEHGAVVAEPEEPLSPEQIAADLEPEPIRDTGPDATVLDLGAARAARSAELAVIEEAATASALAEQLERERAAREAEERAVAEALRSAAQARAAAEAAATRARIAHSLELMEAQAAGPEPVGTEAEAAEAVGSDAVEAKAVGSDAVEAKAVGSDPVVPEPVGVDAAPVAPEPIEVEAAAAELLPAEPVAVTADAGPTEATAEEAEAADAQGRPVESAEAEPEQEPMPPAPVAAFTVDLPTDPGSVERPTAAVAAFTMPAAAPAPLTAGERLGMFSTSRDPLADTASLMRELSSLGDADDEPEENRPVARPATAQTAASPTPAKPAQDKKRKGLFGR